MTLFPSKATFTGWGMGLPADLEKQSSTHSLAPYTEALAVVCLGGWGRNPAGSVSRVSARFKQKPEGQREVNLYNGKLLWTGPARFTETHFLPEQTAQVFPSSVQFTQPCPALCDPMDCSTPGLPVHYQLPEFAQTHVR